MLKKLCIVLFIALFSANLFARDIQKVELKVNSIDCKKCKNKIEKVLKKINGVKNVKVELKNKTVNVSFDRDIMEMNVIIDNLTSMGYEGIEILNYNPQQKVDKNIKEEKNKSSERKHNKQLINNNYLLYIVNYRKEKDDLTDN